MVDSKLGIGRITRLAQGKRAASKIPHYDPSVLQVALETSDPIII